MVAAALTNPAPGGDQMRRLQQAALETARSIQTVRRRREEHQRQAQKNEAIAQLTAGIAHDFNNLLGVVLGALDLIRTHPDAGPGLVPLIDLGEQAALRGASVTRQLLAFARRQPLRPAHVDVQTLLDGLLTLLRASIGERWVITMHAQDDLWPAFVDQALLESALLNLALNARDAQPDGGSIVIQASNVTVDLQGALDRQDVTPGGYVALQVTDAGAGMPETVRARMFEPFFTTKPFGQGSGLGLSMVHGFVRQSGGHITVQSVEDEGTSVTLCVPRSDTPSDGVPASALAESGPDVLAGETLLVVDDDASVRTVVVQVLRGEGYTVIEAASGQDALRLMESDARIDLLFTDMVMPGALSGSDLAEQGRASRPGLKVLFTSGHPLDLLVDEERPGNPVPLLTKPYRGQALRDAVRRALDS